MTTIYRSKKTNIISPSVLIYPERDVLSYFAQNFQELFCGSLMRSKRIPDFNHRNEIATQGPSLFST